jgi:2-haloacid dehalogenase
MGNQTTSTSRARAVVFDFGGVVLDWDPRHLYRRLFSDENQMERFLRETEFGAWNLEQDRGRPFAEGVAELSRRFPEYGSLIAAYHHRWTESIAGPISGTVEILRELKELGYPLFGLSNWSQETFHLVRDQYEFLDWFDLIILSGNEKICKPDPEIFRILVDRSGYAPGDCVFVDDSLINVASSQTLGFQGIQFHSAEALRRELARLRVL